MKPGFQHHSVTVTTTDPVAPETLAVIVAEPVPSRVASPPPLDEMLITEELLELQVASVETSLPFCVAEN